MSSLAVSSSTVKTVPSEAPREAQGIESDKILNERVLRTVRRSMPIDLLFLPRYSLNLAVFLEDQNFLLRVAKHLEKYMEKDEALSQVTLHSPEIDRWVTEKFTSDQELYLTTFYELCMEALKNPHELLDTREAIAGRIYTVKNALISQLKPECLQRSQKANAIQVQDRNVIEHSGRAYILASLRAYLANGVEKKEKSFDLELKETIESMKPLLKMATHTYLCEKGIEVPENPLIYKDPTGNNFNGRVNATFLEVLLKLLGYDCALLERSDLEPRVTLSTAHAVVLVRGADGNEYIVDPTHTQFSEDLVVGGGRSLQNEVLVLRKDLLEDYIETEFMIHWRRLRSSVQSHDESIVSVLKSFDCHLQYVYDVLGLPIHSAITSNMEVWVRSAYTKLWDVSTYRYVGVNETAVEVFTTSARAKAKRTADLFAHMHIPALVEIKTEQLALRELTVMQGVADKIKHSAERVVPLIGQIQIDKRPQFTSLLDLDPRLVRLGGVNPSLNAYQHCLRKIVNPDNRAYKVLYACSGADITSPFLSTNPTRLLMNDFTGLNTRTLMKLLREWHNQEPVIQEYKKHLYDTHFLLIHFLYGAGQSATKASSEHFMQDMELRLVYSLFYLGVDLSRVTVSKGAGGVHLTFPWKHHSDEAEKERRVSFFKADITKPATYPESLMGELEDLDAFFMKAAFEVPYDYAAFMPLVSEKLKVGGFTMTSDYTCHGLVCDPSPYLNIGEIQFERLSTAEKELYENNFEGPYNPLRPFSNLDRKRVVRNPINTHEYWTSLTIRKKIK